MKIRMVRPLPQLDRVIPAGFVLDAPEGFARKMVRTGRAVWEGEKPEAGTETPGPQDAEAGSPPGEGGEEEAPPSRRSSRPRKGA